MRSYLRVLEQIAVCDKPVSEVELVSLAEARETRGKTIVAPPLLKLFATAFLEHGDRIAAECAAERSEEHTSELQSLMRISYAVFCLKKKKHNNTKTMSTDNTHTHHSTTPYV